MGGSIYIRGHSAGYAGMVWETILAEFPNIEGRTVLTAIAFPPALLTRTVLSYNRQVHLIHHADDRLCIWNPSRHDMRLLQQQRFKITHVTGWRAYLGNAQHNYAHWTRVSLPEGCHDLADLERMPGVLPFEVYGICASPPSRAQMPNYTTMVQHFLGTLQLPIAIYMLDYYLPMLSPNEGYNETGLTMQSAGPVREPWQSIQFEFLFKGSEFGHWKVRGGYNAFAFRHPSLAQMDVYQLLESEAHHHKISPVGTGRLIAMVGTTDPDHQGSTNLQVLFGLVYNQEQKRATCGPYTQTV